MAPLLDVPHEVLHEVLLCIRPRDLGAVASCCRSLRDYIKDNQLLWKQSYLQVFDDPRRPDDVVEPDWEHDLKAIISAQQILLSQDEQLKRDNLEAVANVTTSLLSRASPLTHSSRNIAFVKKHFESEGNINTLLLSSSLYTAAGPSNARPASSHRLQQLSAQLHVLCGGPLDDPSEERLDPTRHPVLRSDTHLCPGPAHPYARSKVYDLRQYTQGSKWGPFLDDGSGRVDWEKPEAIMVLLGYNLRVLSVHRPTLFELLWDRPWEGATPLSFANRIQSIGPLDKRPIDDEGVKAYVDAKLGRELPPSLDALDPFGITGTWMRVVCFLDYTDLYAFNFTSGPLPPRQTPREPLTTEEAIRLITLKVRVTKIDPPREDEDGKSGPHTKYPVVHYGGLSRAAHASWDPNANSKIMGTVRMTPHGEVHWTSFSVFHGTSAPRWRSEGVQIGGIRSARGVLGNWFDKDYDVHGPAGPTAFWKLNDDVVDEDGEDDTALDPSESESEWEDDED